jgi:Mg-chelatase subunit ChlD
MSTESATIIANTFIQFQGFQEVPAELASTVAVTAAVELPPAVQPTLQRENAGIYSPTQLPQIPTVESDSGSGGVPAAPDLQDILSFKNDFGVLRVKLADTAMTSQSQLLYFKNDMSGSMQDSCSDGRTKMQHSNHTTSNILRLAAETDAEIWVQVDAFDDKVVSIIPAQRVTKENISQLVDMVNRIMPRNGTNLELALNDSKQKIAEFKEQHPEFVVTQIFTTDGQANTGSQNNSTLAECVDPNYSNIFIGLGIDHSADTLNSLSSRKHGAYYFIDKIENGGLVFGEVIHSILYKALTDVTLTVENAEIYDYRTNQWSSTLEIDSLTGEAEKTYHLRRVYDTPQFDVEVKISGTAATQPFTTTVCCMPPLTNDDGVETPARLELSKYIFRQRTQELLYETKTNATDYSKIQDLKKKMCDFLAKMKAYTQTRPELKDDSTFQTLNDDLVIAVRTLGTPYQAMYTSARANSNGRESSYNVGQAPGAPRRNQGGLRRSNAYNGFQGQDLDQDLEAEVGDELQMLSQGPLARTHTTPRQLTLMRSCSSGTQAEHLLDDDETQTQVQTQVAAFPAIPEAAEDDSTQDLTQDLMGGRCCSRNA